jgi:hypothetical protein
MSDNLPAIGVITAPVKRYMVSIQEDVPYVMLNSLIRVGMAGVSIVSAYITIVAMELRIASIFHAS